MSGWLAACGGGGGDEASSPPAPSPAPSPLPTPNPGAWRMPDEADPHRATWMAFAAAESVWGHELRLPVLQALARIANAIAELEPVKLLVGAAEMDLARQLCGGAVQLIPHEVDDLWLRDSGCVFVKNTAGQRAALSFNFNGWGNKQAHAKDATVAARMAEHCAVPLLRSRLVLEGGGIEVDGQGIAIITESCVLNDNRNPGVSKAEVEAELRQLLGIEKIIWLPGIKGRDITDGHTDFYARFVRPGVVVAALESDPKSFDHPVTRQHLEILRNATDLQGRRLRVETLATPSKVRPAFAGRDFAAGYVNFLLTDKAVFLPEFGDAAADRAAQQTLAALLPQHRIVALNIDAIAAGGGGIHCTTQQEPA